MSSLPNLPNHVSTFVCMSYIVRIRHLFACFRHNHLSLCFEKVGQRKNNLCGHKKDQQRQRQESVGLYGFKLNFIDHLESKYIFIKIK